MRSSSSRSSKVPVERIKELAKKSRILRVLTRKYRIHTRQPRWDELLRKDRKLWEDSLRRVENTERVLLPTTIGAYVTGTTLESLLAVALTLRGVKTEVLLCDGVLPACFDCWIGWFRDQKRFARYGPHRDLCPDCFSPSYRMFRSLGIGVHRYSEFLTEEDLDSADRISSSIPVEDVEHFTIDGIRAGEHALAGTLRFYARGDLGREPCREEILRRYLKASILTARVMERLLERRDYLCAVFHHGIYVPQGIIGEVCRKEGVRVVNWNPGYRKNTFIFSHHDTYHHTMLTEPVENWRYIGWNRTLDKKLADYLKSRWQGSQDWIWFHERPEFDLKSIAYRTGIDLSKPMIGALTSVMWDAKLHYPSNAFSSMLEWMIATIEYFKKRPELQLVIRIHPAEIRGTLPSRQRMNQEIARLYPRLPENIRVIPPESRASTYAIARACDTVIIYNTKTGIELSAMGVPVIVAGEAWIRNKGFAMDVTDPKQYYELLDTLPLRKRMPEDKTLLAKKYAYHFFFRRMIPLEFMTPTGSNPPFRIGLESIRELLPGVSRGLDVVCGGILYGEEFIYPAELLEEEKITPQM